MASTSHRETEDKEEDFSDNDARITLSLSCLDTDGSDNDGLDNLSDYSPRRSRYSPKEPRWPPREATRQSPRESTRRASRASTTRQSSPRPRAYNHYTYPPARRGRRARSPSYHPPGSDEHISHAINLISETRDRRARSPESDKRVGEVLKNNCESFRISKYETQSGTYHCNVIFSPRLVPSRF